MIKYISHRGNLTGPEPEKENKISTIESVLNKGFDCEIDVRFIDNKFYLGHDDIQEEVSIKWLNQRGLWIHCKNIEALIELQQYKYINSFWHQEDQYTLTSHGYIWVYPTEYIPQNSGKRIIANTDCSNVMVNDGRYAGYCSDYIQRLKEEFNVL